MKPKPDRIHDYLVLVIDGRTDIPKMCEAQNSYMSHFFGSNNCTDNHVVKGNGGSQADSSPKLHNLSFPFIFISCRFNHYPLRSQPVKSSYLSFSFDYTSTFQRKLRSAYMLSLSNVINGLRKYFHSEILLKRMSYPEWAKSRGKGGRSQSVS